MRKEILRAIRGGGVFLRSAEAEESRVSCRGENLRNGGENSNMRNHYVSVSEEATSPHRQLYK